MISSINNFSGATQYQNTLDQSLNPKQLDRRASNNSSLPPLDKTQQSKKEVELKSSNADKRELTEEDLKKVEQLKKRDAEVRTHEQAHQSAAGSLSNGGASFDFETGPDKKRYAVGGEVSIDTSKVANDPQATILKARQIRRAALAPAQPSGQDRQVAGQAVDMELQANKEISLENRSSQQNANQLNSYQTTSQSSSQSTDNASSNQTENKIDFYKQIQSASPNNGGVSMLDYYA